MSTLEILRAARVTIADDAVAFQFLDWKQCTCGHIYRAANGGRGADGFEPYWGSGGAVDQKVLEAYKGIVRVLSIPMPDEDHAFRDYARAISHATTRLANTAEVPVEREHALSLIDDAITALEAEQERNRLDVLAQARRIVESAEVQPLHTEPVLA